MELYNLLNTSKDVIARYYVENECEYQAKNRSGRFQGRKVARDTPQTFYHEENEHTWQFVNKKREFRRKSSVKVTAEDVIRSYINSHANIDIAKQYLNKTATVVATADATVSAIVGAEAAGSYNDAFSVEKFSHFLQKDVPITKMKIIAAHNAEALWGRGTFEAIANQTMTIKEILNKVSAVRAFDIDLHIRNGELIIFHSNQSDPFVADSNISKVKDVLTDIHNWQKQHPDEVILLNFENRNNATFSLLNPMLHSIFGKSRILYDIPIQYYHYNYVDNTIVAPTMRELAQHGIKIIVPKSTYISAGHGKIIFGDVQNSEIPYVWEDRTIAHNLYPLHHNIAEKVTTDDVDKIMDLKTGYFISLDHLTPNDQRLFTPEDRKELGLNNSMEAYDHSFHGKTSQGLLVGMGTFFACGSMLVSAGISAFYSIMNERQIRKQSVIISHELAKIAISDILSARANANDQEKQPESTSFTAPITVAALKQAYKRDQLFKIKKTTAIPGASSTISITSSLLSLGIIYPPFTITFSATSVVVGLTGAIATLISTIINNNRLNKVIDEAFELPHVKPEFDRRVAIMNQRINHRIEDAQVEQATDLQLVFDNIIKDNTTANKLVAASITTTGISLVSRITGLAKYAVPAIGMVSAVVCATASMSSSIIFSAINFNERRKKLKNISETVIEQITPDYNKKSLLKLAVFGNTAIESFIENDHENIIEILNLPKDTSFKDSFKHLMLPENAALLNKYQKEFALREWEQGLIATATTEYPQYDFRDIRGNKKLLNNVFNKYIQNKIGEFASKNTWIAGGLGLVSIISVGYFSGMLLLPFIGALFPILGGTTGPIITVATAMKEARLFVSRFNDIINSAPHDLTSNDLRHRQEIDSLLLSWEKFFYIPKKRQ